MKLVEHVRCAVDVGVEVDASAAFFSDVSESLGSRSSLESVTTSDYLLIVDSRFGMFKCFWLSLIKNSNYSLVCLNRF